MHNRGLCVGNPVTSGRTERGSMVHKERPKQCLMRGRKGRRSVDQAFMEVFWLDKHW